MTKAIRQRLFCDVPLEDGASITVGSQQTHHLANVLRYKEGQELRVFNGKDGEFRAIIEKISKKNTEMTCHEMLRGQTPKPTLMLGFAPIKKARIDYIAEKTTEMGIGYLCPVITEYTQMTQVNMGRIASNAILAAEQSERLTLMEINEPLTLDGFLTEKLGDRTLIFCDEAAPAENNMLNALAGTSENAAILIGPEGGFSDNERRKITQHKNAVPVSLGPNILRADTAMLAAVAIWQSSIGDWKGNPK